MHSSDEFQPLHEQLKYKPAEVESFWQKAWSQQIDPSHTCISNNTLSEMFTTSNNLHFGHQRFFIFQDFYSRFHKLYNNFFQSFQTANNWPTETNQSFICLTKSEVSDLLDISGCDKHNILILPPYQPTEDGKINQEAFNQLCNNVNHREQPATSEIDITRLAILRGKPIYEKMDYQNLDFQGSTRFINRLWRLIRTNPETINNVRSGPTINIDQELSDLISELLNEVTKALTSRSTHQIFANLMEFTNFLYNYAQQPAGPHIEIYKQACKTLTTLVSPAAPHLTTEVWHARFRAE